MTNPIRHHYIPQFFLKRWLNSEGILYVYMRGRTEPIELHKKGLINFCQESHLYSIPSIAPEDSEVIETKWFAPLDGDAATIIEKFNRGIVKNLTSTERSNWFYFCSNLYYRSPKGMGDITRKIHANHLSLGLKNKEEMAALILPELVNLDESGRFFINWNWFIEYTDEELLIGDRLPIFNLSVTNQLFTYLAISPNKMFYASLNDHQKFYDRNRRKYKKWIVQNAERFVFANSRKNEEFILKYLK